MKKILLALLFLVSCSSYALSAQSADNRQQTIEMTTHFYIGLDDQPATYYLSRPKFVRTDSEQNIYISDQASPPIKVFNPEGQFIRTIGRAGRGPGEFQFVGLLEVTPDDDVIVMDPYVYTYSRFDNEGELLEMLLLDSEAQNFPATTLWAGDELIGLDFRQDLSFGEFELEEEFLVVWSPDFREELYAFGSSSALGFDARFAKVHLSGQGLNRLGTGSIAISKDLDQIAYSPGIYNGNLYLYERGEDNRWNTGQILEGAAPLFEGSFESYPRVEAMDEMQILERVLDMELPVRRLFVSDTIRFAVGVVMSNDAGVHYLNDGRVIQFVLETVEGENRDWEGHNYVYELYTQIFGPDGAFQSRNHLTTLSYGLHAPIWKDNEDNFYSLETSEGMAVVRKFSLALD